MFKSAACGPHVGKSVASQGHETGYQLGRTPYRSIIVPEKVRPVIWLAADRLSISVH